MLCDRIFDTLIPYPESRFDIIYMNVTNSTICSRTIDIIQHFNECIFLIMCVSICTNDIFGLWHIVIPNVYQLRFHLQSIVRSVIQLIICKSSNYNKRITLTNISLLDN
ncbi:hypothetical protein NY2A_b141L [Paramecium bursaria Chlorella virus NY2A]|uniref:Uncharacterized protein b141L n=1 Tax=Paramecium bursaria Chlorella virus NY2A TaxID=46021 RepID=A7IW16_PBCVN|nr:hypothetical protein NY2A_b141L [Paramecium bursaria Chlorella virus NY2A]YP_001498212.1 hypothetical protein AR158_c130L [Paramecium bursaria Chlorella virus AR158]ABT14540.1 hypothetical protein NY2A_b141L [Paramecium bursaria Chlorella virus NY2A]ABU43676.1 hypothetical protein AR158_c130L [Paramecium bursaria Chlorella virus AR158]